MLLLRHERTQIDGWIEAMTDLQLTRRSHNSVDHALVDGFVSEQPRACGAALTLIVEDGIGCAGNGEIEISIRKDNGWRLAAEFERDTFKVSGGRPDDQLPNLRRAGERYLVHVRMLGKGRAGGLAETRDDVDDAVWDAGFLDEFAKTQGGERS